MNLVTDQSIQTECIGRLDSESQTEINDQNIMTDDKIEVVQGMETFPMQTDENELNKMLPFQRNFGNDQTEDVNVSMSGGKDSNSEVESTLSLVSKSDEKMSVTGNAGLDMRVGKYKELSFPPVSTIPKKPSSLKAPETERTPSPMDLCMKSIAEEDKELSKKKRKPTASTISATPYDYYQPAKSRRLDDIRITLAHQGDVNLSPITNVHLSPIAFMSPSMAVVERSSVSMSNQSSVRDLSVKNSSMKSGDSPILPSKFSRTRSSRLDSFGELSIQPKFTVNKMLTFGMKCKLAETEFTPFTLGSEMNISSLVGSSIIGDKSKSPRIMKMSPRRKTIDKLQLFREAAARKSGYGDVVKSSTTVSCDSNIATRTFSNESEPQISDIVKTRSPRIQGLKLGCTLSRGVGARRFLGNIHGKKNPFKKEATSKNNDLSQKVTDVGTERKKEDKTATIKIEKVDDRILREMRQNIRKKKKEMTKEHSENAAKSTSKLHRKNIEGSDEKESSKALSDDIGESGNDNNIFKISIKEVDRNLKSTDDDNASLTFKDLKNSQKTSKESENSSQQSKSNESESTKSKSTSDDEASIQDGGNDSEEEDNGDDEVVDDDDNKDESLNSTKESIKSEKLKCDKKKEITSPKSIASRVKDYSRKIGHQGITFTSSVPLTKTNIIQQALKSDLKGFTSPRSKELDSVTVAWNDSMLQSNNEETATSENVYEEEIEGLEDLQKDSEDLEGDEIPNESTSLEQLDPTNVESIPQNIFSDPIQPLTSTPKAARASAEKNYSMSSQSMTLIENKATNSSGSIENASEENGSTDSMKDKSDASTLLDETNKPPNKEKKIPDIRFEEILKDSDQHDSEPSQGLLDLYFYKVDQLREILDRLYNADDIKRLSIKLSTSQRAPLSCKIDKMIMFHAVAKFVDKCAGGTSLKKQLGVYVSLRQKKFKDLVEAYYSPKYPFSQYCRELEVKKVQGDELMLVLMAKFLHRNITVIIKNKKVIPKISCTEPNCNKEFASFYNFKLHLNHHKQNFKFFCAVCGQGFMNKNHYVSHSNMHSDTRTLKCGNCRKAFVTNSGLTRHLKGCQVMTRHFQCTLCGKYFKTKETLGKHPTLIHKSKI